jgi:hypothetical protein
MKKLIINTDQFLVGYNEFECVERSKRVNEITGNRIVAGSVFLYSKVMKSWVSSYGFHFWNEDKEGNVWDSQSVWINFPGANLTSTNYRKLDGSKFRWLKEDPTPETLKYQGVIKHLNKVFPKGRGCDVVYVEGFGYNHNYELRQTEWFNKLVENKYQMFS